jgi:cold shock CspA family protein
LKGKIKKFLSYRRYGFIEVDGRESDIFFHVSNYPANVLPEIGQIVEFNLINTPKGFEAKEIMFIGDDEPKPAEKAEETTDGNDLGGLDGVGPKYLELLHAAGINSVQMLSSEAPSDLFDRLSTVNLEKSITKRPPTLENVKAWITLANE